MYKTCFRSILFSLVFSGITIAQETSKKWIPDEFSLNKGFDMQQSFQLSEADWNNLFLVSSYPIDTENFGKYIYSRSQFGVQFGYTKPLQTASNR